MSKINNTEKEDPMLKLLVAMGENGKGIEAQEAQGQRELVSSAQLPSKMGIRDDAKDFYEKVGIKVIGLTEGDEMFYDVELPEGWEKRSTDHSMWSELIDDKGRKRAGIFYKAAFYDRDAFISPEKKITSAVDRIGFINGNYDRDENGRAYSKSTPFCGVVKDYDGTFLFKTEEIELEEEFNEPDNRGGWTQEYKDKLRSVENNLREKVNEFLEENYPEHKDPCAYWDE